MYDGLLQLFMKHPFLEFLKLLFGASVMVTAAMFLLVLQIGLGIESADRIAFIVGAASVFIMLPFAIPLMWIRRKYGFIAGMLTGFFIAMLALFLIVVVRSAPRY